MASRSAYFSRDEEAESVSRRQVSIVSPDVNAGRSNIGSREVLVHALGAPTEFPNSRAVLWDRTPCGNPSYLRSSEVVPALYLSPTAIRALLESLCGVREGSNASVDLCATVVSLDSLSEQQGLGPEKPLRSILGTPPFLLQVSPPSASNTPFNSSSSSGYSNFSLTIPVSRRHLDGSVLDFPKEATTSLIANLGKAVCTTKSSSLRNCMRIRAAGQVQKANGMLNGVLRFEAVLSDVSFQAIKIRPLPMLSTPLSLKLTRATASRSSGGVDGAFVGGSGATGPCMGYLTLNQTRKIVPLLETDPAVSLAPLIGIWVSAEDFSNGQQDEQNQVFLRHPIVWAACLRFLYNEKICDRAFVAQETFLLAVCGGCSVEFFEITRMPNGPQAASSETETALGSSDYLCCDFTVDLAVDEATTDFSVPRGSPRCADPVVCKFRPLSRVEYIRSFREAGVVAPSLRRSLQPTSSLLLKAKSVSASYQGPTSSPTSYSASESPQQQTESLSMTETRTPLPRNASSLPEAIAKEATFAPRSPAPGVHSALISISDCVEEQHRTHGYVSSPFPQQQHIAAFPAEVILSQQIQLDDLRKEVAELRAVIQGLIGGSIPLALASLSSPTHTVPAAASAPDAAISTFPSSAASSSSSSSANLAEQQLGSDNEASSESTQGETLMRTAYFVPPNSSLSAEVASIIESEKDEEEEVEHDSPLYLNREQRADIALPPPRKQAGTRHNPLASRNPTFPVLRPRGEDEADLMEPSAGSIRFGDSAFPSPHAKEQGLDDLDEEEEYDDYDGDGLDISRSSFALDAHLEESSSMYEAESLLAIQAKYLSER